MEGHSNTGSMQWAYRPLIIRNFKFCGIVNRYIHQGAFLGVVRPIEKYLEPLLRCIYRQNGWTDRDADWWTVVNHVSPNNHVLDGSRSPRGRGNFVGCLAHLIALGVAVYRAQPAQPTSVTWSISGVALILLSKLGCSRQVTPFWRVNRHFQTVRVKY